VEIIFTNNQCQALIVGFVNLITFRGPKVDLLMKSEYQTVLIKRCLALTGDEVEIKDKVLYVNGQVREARYVVHKDVRVLSRLYSRDNFGPIKVP
jgi:signal peptidase I